MISPDTIKLLRECDAGIKMGVSSIDEVLGYVHAAKMKKILIECKEEHNAIRYRNYWMSTMTMARIQIQ